MTNLENLDPKKFIIIKGANVNNLKNLSVAIPRNQLITITGLSGSGKSSLAFDTLFAEGQRLYVESLSSYARQFLGRMQKPSVEYIKGISPAIAVEQKVSNRNPRSTVGTTTEIYDYLKLFFSRVGKTYSPISGLEVKKNTVTDVLDFIHTLPEGEKLLILSPLIVKRSIQEELNILLQQGFSRILVGDAIFDIEDLKIEESKEAIFVLIDRNSVQKDDEENDFRMADSIQTAFYEGHGTCFLKVGQKLYEFSDKFEADGISFEQPSVKFFSFNNPYGACQTCKGFGHVLGIDKDLIVPNPKLSVYEGAVQAWTTERMNEEWLVPFLKTAVHDDFPIHKPYQELNEQQLDLLWNGNENVKGIYHFFDFLEKNSHQIKYRVLLSRYKGQTECPDCKGTRLRKDAHYVKINQKSILDLLKYPISDLIIFFEKIALNEHEQKISKRILDEIRNRLNYVNQVGLSYLSLNRLTSTLSGGEYQRIKLATSLGSALVGAMYILDEPSIGLHPYDTQNLVRVLKNLRDLGNTVIVVEHEEEVMRESDQIIDIGPEAGIFGGKLIFQGHVSQITEKTNTLTADYLSGKKQITLPKTRRKALGFIEIKGARENNLKDIDVKFPIGVMTAVTGVSGSGKSTLIKKLLYPAVCKKLDIPCNELLGKMDSLTGSTHLLNHLEVVDQNPIGKSSRSNPVTFTKIYDQIRQLYANIPLSKQRAYTPGTFSFNIAGGRCDTCEGDGTVKIEMQFMADLYLPCEACEGKKFKQEVLEVLYNGKNITQVLDMSVDESILFFANENKIVEKLKVLQDVGLGYISLGQSSTDLSGGEAQRVKLASFLMKDTPNQHTLFVFDEPSTGLHFHDIHKLLYALQRLVDNGNTVIVIEHNLEIIKSADWLIDLGKTGGESGGHLCYEGTPENMKKLKDNLTAQFLEKKLS